MMYFITTTLNSYIPSIFLGINILVVLFYPVPLSGLALQQQAEIGMPTVTCVVEDSNQWIISGHADGRIKWWDPTTYRMVYEQRFMVFQDQVYPRERNRSIQNESHPSLFSVDGLAVHPSNGIVALSSTQTFSNGKSAVLIMDPTNPGYSRTLPIPTGTRYLTFNPNGTYLLVAVSGSIYLFDSISWEQVGQIAVYGTTSSRYHPDFGGLCWKENQLLVTNRLLQPRFSFTELVGVNQLETVFVPDSSGDTIPPDKPIINDESIFTRFGYRFDGHTLAIQYNSNRRLLALHHTDAFHRESRMVLLDLAQMRTIKTWVGGEHHFFYHPFFLEKQDLFCFLDKAGNLYVYHLASETSHEVILLSIENPTSVYVSSQKPGTFYIGSFAQGIIELTLTVSDMGIPNITSRRDFESEVEAGDHILDLEISPDGELIAAASSRGIIVWRISNALMVFQPIEHQTHGASLLSFATVNPLLAVADQEDNQIFIWNYQTRSLRKLISGFSSQIRLLEFSPHDRFLIIGDESGQLGIFDLEQNRLKFTIRASNPITNVAFHPNEQLVGCGFENGRVSVLDIRQQSFRSEYTLPQTNPSLPRIPHYIEFTHQGAYLLIASEQMAPFYYDWEGQRCMGEIGNVCEQMIYCKPRGLLVEKSAGMLSFYNIADQVYEWAQPVFPSGNYVFALDDTGSTFAHSAASAIYVYSIK